MGADIFVMSPFFFCPLFSFVPFFLFFPSLWADFRAGRTSQISAENTIKIQKQYRINFQFQMDNY